MIWTAPTEVGFDLLTSYVFGQNRISITDVMWMSVIYQSSIYMVPYNMELNIPSNQTNGVVFVYHI